MISLSGMRVSSGGGCEYVDICGMTTGVGG